MVFVGAGAGAGGVVVVIMVARVAKRGDITNTHSYRTENGQSKPLEYFTHGTDPRGIDERYIQAVYMCVCVCVCVCVCESICHVYR